MEELSPYLEKELCGIAKEANPDLEIFGKKTGDFSEAWEYNPNVAAKGIASAMGLEHAGAEAFVAEAEKFKDLIPDRYPTFCAGCPHRGTFVALNQALKIQAAKGQEHYFSNDIGCYSMWIYPPISRGDSSLCMGASVGVANGVSHVIEERAVAVVGASNMLGKWGLNILPRGYPRACQRGSQRQQIHHANLGQFGDSHDWAAV